jgi:hypothetical protein
MILASHWRFPSVVLLLCLIFRADRVVSFLDSANIERVQSAEVEQGALVYEDHFSVRENREVAVPVCKADQIALTATGEIQFQLFGGLAGPDGLNDPSLSGYSWEKKFNHGALLGKWYTEQSWNSEWTVVGPARRLDIQAAGIINLSFLVNDWDTWNNIGSFTVELRVYRQEIRVAGVLSPISENGAEKVYIGEPVRQTSGYSQRLSALYKTQDGQIVRGIQTIFNGVHTDSIAWDVPLGYSVRRTGDPMAPLASGPTNSVSADEFEAFVADCR